VKQVILRVTRFVLVLQSTLKELQELDDMYFAARRMSFVNVVIVGHVFGFMTP